MPSESAIYSAALELADCFNRPGTWVDRFRKACSKHLGDCSDSVLAVVVSSWCQTQTKSPTVADLRSAVHHHQQVEGLGQHGLVGCEDCQWLGQRQIALHTKGPTGPHRVFTFAAACDCPKGQHLVRAPGSAFRNWRDLGRMFRARADCVEIYWTDAVQASLPVEATLPPDALERFRSRPAKQPRRWAAMMAETDRHQKRREMQNDDEAMRLDGEA